MVINLESKLCTCSTDKIVLLGRTFMHVIMQRASVNGPGLTMNAGSSRAKDFQVFTKCHIWHFIVSYLKFPDSVVALDDLDVDRHAMPSRLRCCVNVLTGSVKDFRLLNSLPINSITF